MKITAFLAFSFVAVVDAFISNSLQYRTQSLSKTSVSATRVIKRKSDGVKAGAPKKTEAKQGAALLNISFNFAKKTETKTVTKGKKIKESLFSKKASGTKSASMKKVVKPTPLPRTIDVLELPGVLPPVGFFDPLGLAAKANDNILLKYREAELTHGRVAMVAFLGFLFGELASGYNGFLDLEVKGYAIGQITQVPGWFWISFATAAFGVETSRNQRVIVDATSVLRTSPLFGTYDLNAVPGDIGFDPLRLKPEDPEELKTMQTKELQHGRVAMIASSGFLAQELTDQKGIVEHAVDSISSLNIELPIITLPDLPIELPF